MNFGENLLGIASGISRLAEGDGIVALFPSFDLQSAIGFGLDAEGGSFCLADGPFFRLDHRAPILEFNIEIGTICDWITVIRGNPARMSSRDGAADCCEGDGAPDND